MPDRALRRAAWQREGGRCLLTGAPLGEPDSDDWELHHRRPFGMGGTGRADQDSLPNVIAVAHHVHAGIHGNPHWSGPLGLLLPKEGERSDPTAVPVRTWRGWVFLTPDGDYVPLSGDPPD